MPIRMQRNNKASTRGLQERTSRPNSGRHPGQEISTRTRIIKDSNRVYSRPRVAERPVPRRICLSDLTGPLADTMFRHASPRGNDVFSSTALTRAVFTTPPQQTRRCGRAVAPVGGEKADPATLTPGREHVRESRLSRARPSRSTRFDRLTGMISPRRSAQDPIALTSASGFGPERSAGRVERRYIPAY